MTPLSLLKDAPYTARRLQERAYLGASPRPPEARRVLVAAAYSVGAREGHDLLVVEAHAVEDVTEVRRALRCSHSRANKGGVSGPPSLRAHTHTYTGPRRVARQVGNKKESGWDVCKK